MAVVTNWAGNVTFGARAVHAPASLDELRSTVAASDRCRVLGSGHSFNRIADTDGDLISLSELPRPIEIDRNAATVTIGGGERYGELAVALHSAGWALANMASLPHISVAGAVATGTHGSGDRNGALASAVVAVEIVTATGDVVRIAEGDRDFLGAVVALGSLGAVSALTLRIEPTFDVAQRVYTDLAFDAACAHFDEIMASGYSVSLFTRWNGVIEQVWVKQRAGAADTGSALADRLGARPAARRLHPVAAMPAEVCTEQLGITGPWHERLPHFHLDFTPNTGDELQSELFVDRRHAADAIAAVAAIGAQLQQTLLMGEVRTIAADDHWLSMCSGRDSVAFHFSWVPDAAAAAPAVAALEDALAPFDARPHWGKIFSIDPATVRARYPAIERATALAERYDPDRVFANEFTARFLSR